jgi:hypothetical protein
MPALALVLAITMVAALFATSDRALAAYACQPPSQGGSGPCISHFYGTNMAAVFYVEGYYIAVEWNFDSQTNFYAYPQSGNATNGVWMQHAIWTTYTYPANVWTASQTTRMDGLLYNVIGCNSSPCNVAWLALGPNYRQGGYFDYQKASSISAWTDNVATSRALAGIYPNGGASGAWNNTRDQCKDLTVNGATSC